MGSPVSATLSATLDANGAASASYSTPAHGPWTLERMAATGASATAPELRVYRNGTLIDSTGAANGDTSESNGIALMPGDLLRADWTAGTAGARMVLVIEGSAA